MDHLINPEWFSGMHWSLLMLIGAFATYLLITGADWLVAGSSGMALRFGMPKVVIGATIVSLGTTSPEAAVSVMAAWAGKSDLALGNAVGSIIADTALIFGLGCMMVTLPVDRFILNRQGWVQFGSALLLAALCYGAWWLNPESPALARWTGVVLLTLLAIYLWTSVQWGKHRSRMAAEEVDDVIEDTAHDPWWRIAHRFAGGLLLVLIFSHLVVICVSELAMQWGVPKIVIASTIVAFGTSLPELVVGITAIRKGHYELLIGNVIGADILNVLFVIGASAIAAPLPITDSTASIPHIFLTLHLPAMLIVLILFRIYIMAAIAKGHFQRWFGWPLIGLYGTYLILNYALS